MKPEIIFYIKNQANPNDIAEILDALINPVSSYIGCATGIEDDLHQIKMQIAYDNMKMEE